MHLTGQEQNNSNLKSKDEIDRELLSDKEYLEEQLMKIVENKDEEIMEEVQQEYPKQEVEAKCSEWEEVYEIKQEQQLKMKTE
ncbi:hypothetical protein OXYTRIMIC_753 [Oxytricha trifallax]|uniref:Uncharacterized protein n=1 Tax=Oxytricha trifallax TaxID=1172189 RepID=A0A073IB51_9SPIT|nr:hypothetical protein OXYTRIMIC_753 [Oxytricha trifallax]